MSGYGYSRTDDQDGYDDDLYTGFNDNAGASQLSLAPTAVPGTAVRLGTAQFGDDARPMTSVKGAGYRSGTSGRVDFDPLRQANRATPTLQKRSENGPEFVAREMEKEVNALIEESARHHVDGDLVRALDRAKEAAKKERLLLRHCERSGVTDHINLDLSYAVYFCLAVQYEANSMQTEALNTYSALVRKRKQYAQAGRLRVNMGNIYYSQGKYQAAIKMYRMAMDQIGAAGKETRYKIMRNIGNAFVRLGQFQDAIQSYEAVMEAAADSQTGFNLVVCYYARGDKDKMKKGFLQLLSVPLYGDEDEAEDRDAGKDPSRPNSSSDDLDKYFAHQRASHARYVLFAAKLIAPVLEETFEEGYDWVMEHLKAPRMGVTLQDDQGGLYDHIAMEIEICKGVGFLKKQQFKKALDVLRNIERKETELHDQAATNLSFLYFLEKDVSQAKKYADLALSENRYNASALVNRSNAYFVEQDYENAQQMCLEAIGVEADCTEAIYNLGVVSKKAGALDEAMQAFRKLHRIVPKSSQVLYQIADIYERMDSIEQAAEWLKIVQGAVPTDPHILARLGHTASKLGYQTQAFHYFMESYQCYNVNMEVISWLGVWYVKSELYENAIEFFERASEIEPREVKWKLMVASCHRRMGAFQKALDLYKLIHLQDPDSIECLRYLCSICKDLNDNSYEEYAKKLRRLERAMETDSNQFMKEEVRPAVGEISPKNLKRDPGHQEPPPASIPKVEVSSASHVPEKVNQKAAPRNENDDEWGDVELDDDLLPM